MNPQEKRNYIGEDVKKRLLGPGYMEESFFCNPDASNEIIIGAPYRLYTTGVLFPIKKFVADLSDISTSNTTASEVDSTATAVAHKEVDEDLFPSNEEMYEDEANAEAADDSVDFQDSKTDLDQTQDDYIVEGRSDSDIDGKSTDDGLDDYDFEPYHIGLITCLNDETTEVNVAVNYGKYNLVKPENYKSEVRVRLGRCTPQQFSETMAYYDRFRQALGVSNVKKMSDLFVLNNDDTVSPTGKLSVEEQKADGSTESRPLRTSDFPALPRNIAASLVLKLLMEANKVELRSGLTYEDFQQYLRAFEQLPIVKDMLYKNGWPDLVGAFIYDQTTNQIELKRKRFDTRAYKLGEFLYEDDPVKNGLLDKLLQHSYYKREAFELNVTIDLSQREHILNEDVKLVWKVLKLNNKKYLKLQLVNMHTKTIGQQKPNNKDEASTKTHLYQAELCVKSDSIVPFLDIHYSNIDSEYNLNEELYSDEIIYGKGVNCALAWEKTDNNSTPSWVKTTYMPTSDVRSFSTESDIAAVNQACNVHDLSIWTNLTDADIIARLKGMADEYQTWHTQQSSIAGTNTTLQDVIQYQKELHDRLVDNIDYLQNNPRAFSCFKIANAAMYVQMLLGRDSIFHSKTSRDMSFAGSAILNNDAWDYFANDRSGLHPKYRPFQLAFLLMNIKSTFEAQDKFRNDIVDLIWFPTGGGKTEAYLALTALTIAERRTSSTNADQIDGVAVVMRYTLRMLTAQQFERASYLICALEFLRKKLSNSQDFNMNGSPITIGMWIGKASTPNKIADLAVADGPYGKFFQEVERQNLPSKNPFPISQCPWCSSSLVAINPNTNLCVSGYRKTFPPTRGANQSSLFCINQSCYYNQGLPVEYIDERIYQNPPTLLFATVDKFAQLYKRDSGRLFGLGTNRRRPDLIIQDELHLIAGPLGSLVGMFETLVEELSTEKDNYGSVVRRPKIIASTATTRNTALLVKQLYNREVRTFPASGVRYSNNFFSHVLTNPESRRRRYIGVCPTGHPATELEIRAVAAMLVSREKLIRDELLASGVDLLNYQAVASAIENSGSLRSDMDDYWSIVVYYNNLKSLGRAHSRIGQEILANVGSMRNFICMYPSLRFILNEFQLRATEFTSRQDSTQIKQLIKDAESPTQLSNNYNMLRVTSRMDIVQATNMISVGIDISRWNMMIINGQPLTTAEYIQSSSRVGRSKYGLILNLYNPRIARELSYFENYEAYHQVFYKYVEPLSVTSFTEMTLDKLLSNLYITYMVHVRQKTSPANVDATDLAAIKSALGSRATNLGGDPTYQQYLNDSMDKIHLFFTTHNNCRDSFEKLLMRADVREEYNTMLSLRDVESNTFISL